MLLYFILGIIFISFIVPLIENLLTIIATVTQYISYIYAAKIYKIKQQLGLTEQQEQKKNPIGFQTSAIGFSCQQEYEQEE